MVVGNSGTQPYVWQDGVLTSIPVPPGLGFGGARRASDNGYVVGTFGNQNQNARAYRWKEDEVVLLEPVAGHPVSVAWGVNNSGWVVGACRTQLPKGQGYASTPTLWTPTTSFALPAPPGYSRGYAVAVDDAGVVLGHFLSGGTGFPSIAVIWIDGVVYKINELTTSGSSAVGSLQAINSHGQILNSGSAKVLTPLGQSFADVNGDCAVDGADIAKLLGEWGPREWSVADLDDDGVVDGRDLGLMLGEWNAASK